MEFLRELLNPAVVWVVIPVVAIVMSIGKSMLSRHYDHQERMAEIEAGLIQADESEED